MWKNGEKRGRILHPLHPICTPGSSDSAEFRTLTAGGVPTTFPPERGRGRMPGIPTRSVGQPAFTALQLAPPSWTSSPRAQTPRSIGPWLLVRGPRPAAAGCSNVQRAPAPKDKTLVCGQGRIPGPADARPGESRACGHETRRARGRSVEPSFSDISWERFQDLDRFGDVQFCDYTKIPNRLGATPENYLTFSRSETNEPEAKRCLRDFNVAVSFGSSRSAFGAFP